MAVEKLENRVDRDIEIDLLIVAETVSDAENKISLLALARRHRGVPAFEKDAADQNRQLRRKIGHFRRRQPVPHRVQNGSQEATRARFAPAKILGKLLDPLLRLLASVREVSEGRVRNMTHGDAPRRFGLHSRSSK